MTLSISDRPLRLPETVGSDVEYFDLSSLKIANCMGCFGCWTKTPGKCVIRDDAVKIYPRIAASRQLLYVSRVKYGSYDVPMKTMLERAIPVQQAFIRLLHGETHHVQRDVVPKQAVIIAYGEISQEGREIFRQLVARNAANMSFERWRIVFSPEDEVEQTVRNEVLLWEKS